MQDIIAKLTAKDDKYACAIADKIISESQDIKLYPKVRILAHGTNTLMRLHPCLIIQSH